MPGALHQKISQHFAILGFNLPGSRPTLREAIAKATGESLEAMRREHLKVPSPDAWVVDPEYRTVVCIEVDITHRAELRKYAPLWRWLDAGEWHLYIIRANHEGLTWAVDISEHVFALENAGKPMFPIGSNPMPPVEEHERYNTVLGKHGVKLHWPSPTDELVIRMKQPDGSWLTLEQAPDTGNGSDMYPGDEPSQGELKFDYKIRPDDKITMTIYYGDEEPPP